MLIKKWKWTIIQKVYTELFIADRDFSDQLDYKPSREEEALQFRKHSQTSMAILCQLLGYKARAIHFCELYEGENELCIQKEFA